MEELKTLKDIVIGGIIDNSKMTIVKNTDLNCCAALIKQEAIKWAKSWIENEDSHSSRYDDVYAQGKLDAFEEFFNITREDLK